MPLRGLKKGQTSRAGSETPPTISKDRKMNMPLHQNPERRPIVIGRGTRRVVRMTLRKPASDFMRLALSSLLLAGTGIGAQAASPAPLRGLEEVGQERVELQGGFWGPRLKTGAEVTIPHALNRLEQDGHVTNFAIAAGKLQGPPSGHAAFDSDLHKALEGAMYALQHYPDPALRQRVDGILDQILAAQQPDGYLVSYYIIQQQDQRWNEMRTKHPLYNAGHFFEMAVAHQQLTGDPKMLNAAKRFADNIDSVFGIGKRYDVDGHQEVELALVKLYRATGERRYLELARFFLDERGYAHGTARKPFDYKAQKPPVIIQPAEDFPLTPEQRRANFQAQLHFRNGRMQDHKPVVEQLEAVGHAVRAGYMYAAMADIVRFMDALGYERALDSIWNDVMSRKLYITGGLGTGQYDDEGFGDPYLLPNDTYCESCAAIAHVLWQHRMALLKGQAKYADVMELTLYNGMLSGISISGNQFFYQNPLTGKDRRRTWIGLSCCPSNLARIIPEIGGLAYARGRQQVVVNLYLAGDAAVALPAGPVVKLTQQTEYPWDGHVKLTVTPAPAAKFDLSLRIPGWALGRPVPSDLYHFADTKVPPVEVKVNGERASAAPAADGYVHLPRTWQAGDVVELNLPMPIQRVYAHKQVKEDEGKVALMRGPVVYCLETVDQSDANVLRLVLPRDAKLQAAYHADLLGGVTTLTGQALADGQRPVALTAVPYYAWANRTTNQVMTVWLNETPVRKSSSP